MQPELENWNIVVAGQWNVAVFSPQWLGLRFKELYDNKIPQIDLEFLADLRGTQMRFQTEHLIINPTPVAFIVGIKQIDDESLSEAEGLVRKILEMLPHTPVNAFGINFAFTDENLTPELIDLFRLNDDEKLAEHDYRRSSTLIQRTLEIDGAQLNARLTLTKDSTALIGLNFHHNVETASEAAKNLTSDIVIHHKNVGLTFLEDVYGLIMEKAE